MADYYIITASYWESHPIETLREAREVFAFTCEEEAGSGVTVRLEGWRVLETCERREILISAVV